MTDRPPPPTALSVAKVWPSNPAFTPAHTAAAKLIVLNKIDLLPHVSFDMARCMEYALRVKPDIQILTLSATPGAGMAQWLDWLTAEQPSHSG